MIIADLKPGDIFKLTEGRQSLIKIRYMKLGGSDGCLNINTMRTVNYLSMTTECEKVGTFNIHFIENKVIQELT